MRILYCGDVVGKAGRKAVVDALPGLRERLNLDLVLVNGENAAHGFGITGTICDDFLEAGADLVLTGNHAWDKPDIITYMDREPRLLRPINASIDSPGRGAALVTTRSGLQALVVQVQGRLFMPPMDDPFAALDHALADHQLGRTVDAIMVDIHAEATSEKMGIGQYLDGRASLVAGTHTHVPTGDAQILPGGTGYITDVGMCGDYDSVIGMKKDIAVERMRQTMPGRRLEPADGPATLCAVFVETDDTTGLARRISPLRMGGRLENNWPNEEESFPPRNPVVRKAP